MLGKRLLSLFKRSPSSQISRVNSVNDETSKDFGRKAVSFILITVTGGVALSALNDLAIYYNCSRKAMEKASKNQAMIDALGEPIKKGAWYNASLALAHKRHSVSCSFPVSGPQGTGVLQLKAVSNRSDDSWYSYIRPRNWEILMMDALLHVPGNDEKQQTFRISISDSAPSPACVACTASSCTREENPEKKLEAAKS